TFKDGATTLGSVAPGPTGGPNHESRAQFTTSGLAVGNHNFVAVYGGEIHNDALDPTNVQINQPSTSGTVAQRVNPLVASDVSALVSVTKPRHQHHSRRQQVMLRNTSGKTITGPVFLLLGGLTPKVRLKDAAGV